jgi:molybdopterin molybdotransferase
MAQLTDDCFAFGGETMTVDEAVRLIGERIQPVSGTETVGLAEAQGRVLAAPIRALVSVPSTDNSAVDGYAVRHADLSPDGPTRLPVAGRVQAGGRAGRIAPGTAVRIFTGASMPEGADTVFMQEDTQEDGDAVILPAGLKMGANRRFSGEDFAKDAVVLPQGTRLDARHLATLAAIGHASATVRRRVRVALFSTGDELTEPGATLPVGGAYDANRTLLAALLAARGALVSDLGILRDDAQATAAALEAAARAHDCILTSGGVSTGEADFVKSAVETHGRLTFWRLAIKPGRPVAMGTINGAAFIGLPGNPVAAFVTFARLAAPLIDRLGGTSGDVSAGFPAIADFHAKKKAGRREYMRGAYRVEGGKLVVSKFPKEGAALLSSLIETDGLIELGEAVTRVVPGDSVTFLPYSML